MMKKIITFVAVCLFALNATAQDAKAVVKEKAAKESCCAVKASTEKAMTAAEFEKCKIKCKAEGKKCDATMVQTEGKKCDAKMATADGKSCCMKKV